MTDSHPTQSSGRPAPDLLLPFSAAVGLVLAAIAVLAVAQTVAALVLALAALLVLLAAVVALVTRVMADEDDAPAPPARSTASEPDRAPVAQSRRRLHLPTHRTA